MRLFISYARIDKPYCIHLVTTLGVHEVWYDQRLYAGQHWWKEILRRLDWCEGLIYLLSPESVSSEYCLKELEIAQRLGREIIPVLIQPNTEIPPSLAQYQYVDMTNGMSVENLNLLWDSIYLAEQRLSHRKPKPATQLPKNPKDLEIIDDAKVVGQAASALENGEYDRAVFLLRQAKASGYLPRFIDLDRLLKEAEIALEQKTREREAKREYDYILDLYQYTITRDHACEAFAEFQKYYPEYDPEGLAKRCGRPTPKDVDEYETQEISVMDFDVLPLLKWSHIPSGKVRVEDPRTRQDRSVMVDGFHMSRYPITNAQFEEFVCDPNGYSQERWWAFSTRGHQWYLANPIPLVPKFGGDERPRETVNWYEAMAFCAWLSSRISKSVKLPTLDQWQRAAFGEDDRLFPWGNTYDPKYCNTRESGLKMTTFVRRYEEGVSPFEVYDMAGNVWEWCLDEGEAGRVAEDDKRAVVGGSFVSPCDRAQRSFHYFLNPEARYSSIGFRVVMLD